MIGSRRERKATPLVRIRAKFAEEVREKCDNSAESQKLPSQVDGRGAGRHNSARFLEKVHATAAAVLAHRARARSALQPQLAGGPGAKAWPRSALRAGATAVHLRAREEGAERAEHRAVHLPRRS